jgi:mannose-6-phosphate isomerase-like protein (cupin superfamily)
MLGWPQATVSPESARQKPLEAGRLSALMFAYGSLELRFYAPHGSDRQTPHTRDEVYVVAEGRAWFVSGETRREVSKGDALFVAAGVAHRFEDLSADFATWVLFYGTEVGQG